MSQQTDTTPEASVRHTELLKEQGLKVTQPRVSVLQLLHTSGRHLSVDEVYHLIRADRPRTSMATVYRVLEDLSAQDIIGSLRMGRDRVLYEYRTDEHRHVICSCCGEIRDVEAVSDCIANCLGEAAASGYHFERADVIFLGMCPVCQDNGSSEDE